MSETVLDATPDLSDETDEERLSREETEVRLSEDDKGFIKHIVENVMLVVVDTIAENDLYGYQRPFSARIIESLILQDGATLTALFSRQSGKSLSVNTPLLTVNGWKTMGTVELGDKVYAPDGTPTPVIAMSKVFDDHDCYEVLFSDNQIITADANHWWTVTDCKNDQSVTLTTKELLDSGIKYQNKYRYRISMTKPLEIGTSSPLPLDPYLLGCWLGDGSSQKAEITTADPEIINAFVDAGFSSSYEDSKNTGRATTYGLRNLYTILSSMNLIKNHKRNMYGYKHIPEQYLLSSKEDRLSLLQGLMDTDGYASIKGNEFCSTNEALAEDVLFLVRSLGWKAVMAKGTATLNGVDCGPKYRVCWVSYQDGELAPFRLPRKVDKQPFTPASYKRARRTTSVFIKDIRLVETVPVRCIGVAHPSHLFLAGSGLIPTHNTETVANTVVACMIMFPVLAKVYPKWFGRFRVHGLRVGAFAPVDEQADNLYTRMVECLTSDRALEFMSDPDIDDSPTTGRGKMIQLKRLKSFIRKQTAHPRASIEGRTYDLILIDECQSADEKVVTKSISPMGASTRATKVYTGTPTYTKGIFYKQIQTNKRQALRPRGKQNHFEADWKQCAKWNPNYGKYVKDEMLNIGQDSDEFQLSYMLKWLLDKGMFTSSERISSLGDPTMEIRHGWSKSPCVVGIDPARKQDSTIVTVVWVNWDRPDENGYYEHRVLNWLDLTGVDWEEQYFRIQEFLSNYWVTQAAVDEGGMGDVVVDRLRRIMPNIDWVPINSQRPEQSKRWKHLGELIRRGAIGWPAHPKTRRLKTWRRFIDQMENLELKFEGPYVLAEAPNEAGAHDDYADSLALACVLTKDHTLPMIEVSNNFFFA